MRLGVNTLFYLPGEVGGSETYLLETLRALTRRDDVPELVLFANLENAEKLRAEFPGAEVIELRVAATNRYSRIVVEQLRLPWLVKRACVDVLWSPGYTAPAVCACPQVATLLDMQYKRFPEDVSWLAARTMDVLYPLAAWRSRTVVAISEFSKSEIASFIGIAPSKIAVTYPGVDPAFGEAAGPPPGEVRGRPYLLCVAHSYPHKNLALLIRAFGRLTGEFPHRLVLVGKPRRGEAEVKAALEGIPRGDVVRLRELPCQSMRPLYQGANWFVFPSLYEGFGLPVLEAMAAGVPVLTTREGAISEVGGDAVRYADGRDEAAFAAAMREAIQLPREDRTRLVRMAKTRAASFTWEASAAGLWQVLVKVAGCMP